ITRLRPRLDEIEHLRIAGVDELHAEVALQRRVFAANAIEPADLVDDVAGRLPVARAQFVLLRVEVLLLARDRLALAQLEAAVEPPQSRQRRRQRGANDEAGPPRGLQENWIDIGRVDEEMRAEKIA